jgi:hypothetical protein
MTDKHYVYAYYDPRNFEIFYIGKGQGKRKFAHLSQEDKSEKTKRIKEIQNEELEPIIRVLVKDLEESEAYLVEKTLIWSNYKSLTNKSSGLYKENFRPENTLHKEIKDFDFTNGIYYVNVGEGDHRDWDDCSKYNFLCAGGDPKWSDPLKKLEIDDIVVAYLKGRGYVGIGKVVSKAIKAIDFRYNDKLLSEYKDKLTQQNIFESSQDDEKAQYVVGIEWICKKNKEEAVWKKSYKLYTTQLIVASLLNQAHTISFLEKEFKIKFEDCMK